VRGSKAGRHLGLGQREPALGVDGEIEHTVVHPPAIYGRVPSHMRSCGTVKSGQVQQSQGRPSQVTHLMRSKSRSRAA
jgi:hypothetical protein